MKFWEKITGRDISKLLKTFDKKAKNLPDDYQLAWKKIQSHLWLHSDFSGRNLMPIFENVLEFLEETAASDLSVREVMGEDIKGFCSDLLSESDARSFRDKWHDQVNKNIARKLKKN